MIKMYLEDIKWNEESDFSVIIFGNLDYEGKLELHVSGDTGFDLWEVFTARIDPPYLCVTDIFSQIGAEFTKFFVRQNQEPGTIGAKIKLGEQQFDVEMTVRDAMMIAITDNLPVYFDENMCKNPNIPLATKLSFTRTASLTKYSFDGD